MKVVLPFRKYTYLNVQNVNIHVKFPYNFSDFLQISNPSYVKTETELCTNIIIIAKLRWSEVEITAFRYLSCRTVDIHALNK